jgi:O-antigen ligase
MSQSVLLNWWDSKLARRLDLVGAAVAICILWRIAWQEDLTWVGAVIVSTAVIVLTATRWPYGALIVLIATSAMPVFYVEVFGWKARPEHFAGPVVFVAAAIWLIGSKQRVRFDKLDYWILAYIGCNFISSAFGSAGPASTLRWALQNCLAVLGYFLVRWLIRDLQTLRNALGILLGVGLLESVYGTLCYVSHEIFGSSVGVAGGQYLLDVAAPYGSLYEPNLFGAYTACCAVVFLALYLFEGHRLHYLVSFLIASLAAVISFSRAALLALIIVICYVIWKDRRARRNEQRSKAAVLILAVALFLLVAYSPVGDIIRERFANLYYEGLTEETTISRAIILQQASQEIPGHLLIGNGTASFNLSFDWARIMPLWAGGEGTWIGNAPLRILHDTGVLGLTAFLGFFVAVWLKIRRARKKLAYPDGLLTGLVAGTLVYAIAFESTDGTMLSLSWVHLGFLASAAILLSGYAQDLPDSGSSLPVRYAVPKSVE